MFEKGRRTDNLIPFSNICFLLQIWKAFQICVKESRSVLNEQVPSVWTKYEKNSLNMLRYSLQPFLQKYLSRSNSGENYFLTTHRSGIHIWGTSAYKGAVRRCKVIFPHK